MIWAAIQHTFPAHAKVKVAACARQRLEKLCRYVACPPIAQERLSVIGDGQVLYRLKRLYRDGSTHVLFEPMVFLERLAALVPRPRVHLVTYHGVLAPASPDRALVVPEPPAVPEGPRPPCRGEPKEDGANGEDRREPRPRRYYRWAELMQRVFEVDVLLCEHCGQSIGQVRSSMCESSCCITPRTSRCRKTLNPVRLSKSKGQKGIRSLPVSRD